jgi:hypothetical protein
VRALFEMQVKDTFRLGDHMTAFIGPVESELKFIRACDCEIIVDNEVKGAIRIDGEMILTRRQPVVGETALYRSISSSEPIDLDGIGVGKSWVCYPIQGLTAFRSNPTSSTLVESYPSAKCAPRWSRPAAVPGIKKSRSFASLRMTNCGE